MDDVSLRERFFHWKRESKARFNLMILKDPELLIGIIGDLIIAALVLTFVVGMIVGATAVALTFYFES